jgi:GR25 family glycosyltransferase involved in LPS biosynthesis
MYKTFIITLANTGHGEHRESAVQMLSTTLWHCNQHGWNTEIVDAVNGYALTETDWENFGFAVPKKSNKKLDKFGNLPGAQGCFLSHYKLWQRCVELDQPIVIFEDDAEVLGPMPTITTDKDLIKLHDPRHVHQHKKLGSWAPGAFAYWLTPKGAQKLIEFSKTVGPGHADKQIGSNVLDWDYLTPHVVKLGSRIGSSTNPDRYPYGDLSRC